jgi:23S rRNA pseudouridine2605 synthase
VRVDGVVRREPSFRVDPRRAVIEVDGRRVAARRKVYLALNKPRGLVTTRDDPQGRATVYECLDDAIRDGTLPFVGPVGRLDKASEGLLLFTNDTRWAARLRRGERHAWLEVVLDEGRNRHIRRLLGALDVEVLRLVRVAIGPLALGTLGKGAWRHLTSAEVAALAEASGW